jgi:hypothetical protein
MAEAYACKQNWNSQDLVTLDMFDLHRQVVVAVMKKEMKEGRETPDEIF